MRVLVIDDDVVIRRVLMRLLGRPDYETRAAGDGESGLAALAEDGSFDAVICDLGLPGISGIEVVRRIRSGERHRDLPVIMLTGDGAEETRGEALDCGADLFLTKPFSSHEILGALKQVGAGTRSDRGWAA
jgi:DNA-binding response OmpR family regulator